jgi:beta-glucuronidase
MVIRKSADGHYEVEIRTRQQLPAYTLSGYSLRWIAYGYDDLPMAGGTMALPAMEPGSSHRFSAVMQTPELRRIVVDVLRPTGFSAMTVAHLERDGSN